MMQRPFYLFIKKNFTYSVSLLIERGIVFLLLPLYTHILAPAEYGIYAVLLSFIAFATFFYSLGIENGLLRFLADRDKDKESVLLGTVFWSMAGIGLLFSVLLFVFSGSVSTLLFRCETYSSLIRLSSGILFTDTLIRYFLYRLLGFQKSRLYFTISLMRGIVSLIANGYFLLYLKQGLNGVFVSYLASNLLILPILAVFVFTKALMHFNWEMTLKMVRFGFPVMLASLFITLINFIDRFLLQIWISPEQAGLYSAAYRIGFIMNLIITAFSMGAVPFSTHALNENPNERKVFSTLMNLLIMVCSVIFIVLGLFTDQLVQIRIFGIQLINERYWTAMRLVPVILYGYIYYGMAVNFSLGLYWTQKTGILSLVSCIAFCINLLANWICIPRYGSWGAAVSTGITFAAMSALLFFYSRRYFSVRYDWFNIFFTIIMVSIVLCSSIFRPWMSMQAKLMMALFSIGLVLLSFWGSVRLNGAFKRLRGNR